MKYVTGYEKAWLAFLNGGIVASTITALLWVLSVTGSVAVPEEIVIVSMVTGVVQSIASGIGAFLGTMSPIPPDPNATPAQKIAAASILGTKAGAAAGASAGAEAAGAKVFDVEATATEAGAAAGGTVAPDVPRTEPRKADL